VLGGHPPSYRPGNRRDLARGQATGDRRSRDRGAFIMHLLRLILAVLDAGLALVRLVRLLRP